MPMDNGRYVIFNQQGVHFIFHCNGFSWNRNLDLDNLYMYNRFFFYLFYISKLVSDMSFGKVAVSKI